VFGHGLVYILVNGQQGLTGTPVHLADELSPEGIDDARNGGSLALADEIEIEHALNGSRLETVNKTSRLVMEECVFSTRAQRSAWCREAADIVVGRKSGIWSYAIGGGPIRSDRRHREDGEGE